MQRTQQPVNSKNQRNSTNQSNSARGGRQAVSNTAPGNSQEFGQPKNGPKNNNQLSHLQTSLEWSANNTVETSNLSSQSYVNLEAKKILGQGSFGFVFEAVDRDTGQTVAVKRTMKAGEYVSREFQVLDKLQNCPNVVKLLNIYYSQTEDKKCVQNMVFEFCSTNLEDVIQSHKNKNQPTPIPMGEIRDYMRQIFEGMRDVHTNGICHRDLKPENILKNQEGVIKICDFGSAKVLTPAGQNTPYIVSRYYRAPELILACSDYSNKIDIWAIGCIFAEFVTLRPLFPGKTEGSQFLEQVAILGKPSQEDVLAMSTQIEQNQLNLIDMIDDIPRRDFAQILPQKIYNKTDIKNVASLLEQLLEWDPHKRITCAQALQHKFFC